MFRAIKNKLLRREDGTVAVEFALLGLPFIIMLIGIVEMSLFFATGVVLEGATGTAAREIRTGQVQASPNPLQAFQNALCSNIGLLINCVDLQYEVLTVPGNSFSNASALQPTFDANGNLVSAGFQPGTASQDVLIRVVYRYQFLTPFLGTIIGGGMQDNLATLMSTVAVKNEPYNFGS